MPAPARKKSSPDPEPKDPEPDAQPANRPSRAPAYDEFDMDCWEPSLADRLRRIRER